MKSKIIKAVGFVLLAIGIVFLILAYKEHKPFMDARIRDAAVKEAVIDMEPDDPLDRRIDFEALKSINPDIVGWLYIPQIGVDYPILKGSDNSSYLSKDFEGNYSPLGSIFTWTHTDHELTAQHICLFGHNMPSGQMFGNLKLFQDKQFQEKNKKLYLYTPEHTKKLEVMEVYECYMSDGVFQDSWESGRDVQTVTLATCVDYSATSYRLAVNCEVVQEKLIL